jgi:CheY-like chemotaxis protein
MMKDQEKKTLLIVDDVELFIQLQVSHLGHQRYHIHTARSGAEGLQMARSLKPDLILMDLFMPDMNGDQICRLLKEDPETSSIPVVLVSSGGRGRSRAASVSSQCDGLIFKPVRRDLLLSVVENLLGTNLRTRDRVGVLIHGTAVIDETECPVTLHTLSSDGAFVQIEPTPIRGDMMELSFPLPDHEKVVNVRSAAVVWCGSLAEEGPDGVGVHFLTIDTDAKKQISGFVQKQISSSSASFDEDIVLGDNSR